jgi:hypothetical protein
MSRRKLFFGASGKEYLLNFSKASGNDYLGAISSPPAPYYIFTGAFTLEIDFEYSALDSSYAPCWGLLITAGNPALRLLVGSATTLVSMVDNTNLSFSKSTSTNTKYNVKIRRDSSNIVYISYDGASETNIGTRVGNVTMSTVGRDLGTGGRFLTGKVYRFNINGEEFPCNEGSGATVTGSLGTVIPINTSNAGGITYINTVMWQEI